MGRPRKSLDVHGLDGTRPHYKPTEQDLTLASSIPFSRPKFLRDIDARIRPIAKRLCKRLEERRTLTAADADLIRLYVVVFDRHERNLALLRDEGELVQVTVLDSKGYPHQVTKTNLRLKVCAEAEKQLAALLEKMGLTPATKDKIKPGGALEKKAKTIVPGSMADTSPWLLTPDERESFGLPRNMPEPVSNPVLTMPGRIEENDDAE